MDKKYNVLVVDDSPICRQIVEIYLNKLYENKVNLKFAENGQEALDLVNNSMTNGGLDLILMDIKMPVLDGFDSKDKILEKYREQKLNPPKIVAFTAYVMHKDKEKIIHSGFDGYLSKPLTLENYKTLDKYLN